LAPLRIGLIGCGRLAERGYLDAIRRARGVRLSGLADPEQGRCEALAEGLPAHRNARELLAAGDADALVLAHPADVHLPDARLASAEGIPVLIEKPPAPSAAEAEELAALHPPPSIGFNLRFDPGVAGLRRHVPSVGELELLFVLHHAGDWRSYAVSDDALLRLGPHPIDLARWLSRSEVEAVRALELEPGRVELELELSRGRVRISCATNLPARELIELRIDGRPRARWSSFIVRRGLRRLRRPFGAGALVRSLALQLEDFVRFARGLATLSLAGAADGRAVMEVIDAARRSADSSGGWQPVRATPVRE
jgi:predicted dehydrogenase